MVLNQSQKGTNMSDLFDVVEALEKLADKLGAGQRMTPANLDEILADPAQTLRLALGAAAGASNAITCSKPGSRDVALATLLQDQADLWLRIHERQIEEVDRTEAQQISAQIRREQQSKQESIINRPTNFGRRLNEAFSTRPGSPKFPPGDQVTDPSSGNEDKPVT